MAENKIKITPAKGRPMLHWVGKKPLDYVKGFPTQLIEVFDPLNNGQVIETPTYDELKDNWQNLLFHGDNKDVLATLLELGFRGKIDLIYIDPPFKSGADYVRKVELRGLKNLGRIEEDEASILQQTMYFDIWNNDTYLQFMYERLTLLKELLADTGSIYVHLDWHVSHYIKLLMDEVFGQDNFRREIIWWKGNLFGFQASADNFVHSHDNILYYTKNSNSFVFNKAYEPYTEEYIKERFKYDDKDGKGPYRLQRKDQRQYLSESKGVPISSVVQVPVINVMADERLYFDTQKPEGLIEKLVKISSNSGDIVVDCFIGSGTSARVAQKMGRRWIGCDINKGAIHLTSRELQNVILNEVKNLKKQESSVALLPQNDKRCHTFAIYKVNDCDLQLLKTEAIELAVQHIGIQRLRTDTFFDGYLGRNLVKIIDFNHPLTLLDLQLLQDELKKRPDEDRDITIVCLGKELAIDPEIEKWNKTHPVNKIKVIELKTDKKYGGFLIHKPAEAKIKVKRIDKNKARIEIQDFISPTIIERLNIDNKLFKVKIPDFRCMIDTVLIDNNYDGKTFHIVYSDVPERKDDLVKGKYEIETPSSKTRIAVKIIDMLGEEVINVFDV